MKIISKNSTSKWRLQNERQAYMFLALPLIGFFVFTLYPLCWAIGKGFCYYDGIESSTRFVGMENYIRMFTDSSYWKAWLTTIQFALIKIPIELSLALIVAAVLNREIRVKGFFRGVFFLPTLISCAIVALVFTSLFDYYGFMNAWLVKLGFLETPVEWLATKWRSMFLLVLGSTWMTFGINVLYFTAAFSNVPKELYEAASLDGAGTLSQFKNITLPSISKVSQTILLLSINGTLHENDWVIAMTGGAPAGETYTVMSYLLGNFVPGFAKPEVNVGYGCCLATVTAILMAIIAVVYNKLSKKMKEND